MATTDYAVLGSIEISVNRIKANEYKSNYHEEQEENKVGKNSLPSLHNQCVPRAGTKILKIVPLHYFYLTNLIYINVYD